MDREMRKMSRPPTQEGGEGLSGSSGAERSDVKTRQTSDLDSVALVPCVGPHGPTQQQVLDLVQVSRSISCRMPSQ